MARGLSPPPLISLLQNASHIRLGAWPEQRPVMNPFIFFSPFLWLQYCRSNGKGSGCRATLEGPTLNDSEWYCRVTQEEPPVISDQSVLFPRWVTHNRAIPSGAVPLSSVQLPEESTKHVCCSPANANYCHRSVLWTETLWIPQYDASLFPSRVFEDFYFSRHVGLLPLRFSRCVIRYWRLGCVKWSWPERMTPRARAREGRFRIGGGGPPLVRTVHGKARARPPAQRPPENCCYMAAKWGRSEEKTVKTRTKTENTMLLLRQKFVSMGFSFCTSCEHVFQADWEPKIYS